jgi:hypothetical protein
VPCHAIDGCFRGDEVNIGYRPYRAVSPTAIRVGRDERFRVVDALEPGQGVGRQTVRNPDYDALPAHRPPQSGDDGRAWVWVYARAQGGSGWIPLEDIEPTVSPPGRPCRGPAGFDFEPGVMPSKHGPHTTCGQRLLRPARWRRRACAAPDAYIRWSPDGTAWDYLVADDLVELRSTGPRGFACVTVIRSATVAAGESGWVEASALGRAGAQR